MHSRAVLLASVLLLAGCSGLGGPPDPGQTVTPAPVPTPETGTPSPTAEPGPDRDGGVPPLTLAAGTDIDATRLAANHRAVLRNRSYRLIRHREQVVTENGTVIRRVVQTERIWVGENGTYRYDLTRNVTTAEGSSWYNRSLYANGNRILVLVESADGREVTVRDDFGEGERFADLSARTVRQYLTNPEQTVTERGDRFLIRGRGSSHPDQTFTTNNTVRAVVAPNGLVVTLSASYEERARIGPRRVTESFTVADIERVPEPDWLNATVD